MPEMRVSLPIVMSGIYLHIPFCKQACHYCDFHFSTNTSIQPQLVEAMAREIVMRQDYLEGQEVATLYFGGGTPSLLESDQIESLLSIIQRMHHLSSDVEITIEVNPDDVTPTRLKTWRHLGINRLSIGIQSFNDSVLQFLNRSHSAKAASDSVELARNAGFENFSIDLIYAIPGTSTEHWKEDLRRALDLDPPHLSAYTLTIEEKTVFANWTAKGKMRPVDELAAAEQLEVLMEALTSRGYRQYEISNFAKPGFESRHNSSYWKGVPYLGIGPSAHSYNGRTRQANVANNHLYVKALEGGSLPAETETLTRADHINEYILTSLRTDTGCDLAYLKRAFDHDLTIEHRQYVSHLLQLNLAELDQSFLRLTGAGKLLADKITADLFFQS